MVRISARPAQWSDTVWAGTKNNVQLSLPGYIDSRSIIAADQWSIGRVVVSVLCFFPGLLWSTDYRPSYEFALQPAAGWNQPSGQMPPGYYPPPIPPGAYPPPPAGDPNQPPPLPSRQGL